MRSVRAILANARRYPGSFVLHLLCAVASVFVAAALVLLIGYILATGIPHLKPSLFAMDYNSENVSLLPALFNTVIMTLLSLALAVPLGVGGAIYLAEYANRDSKIVKAVRLTAETLAGIPSILYGLFGMMFFVTSLRWSYSLLAGGMTLAVMILPLILRTTEEALSLHPGQLPRGQLRPGRGQAAHGYAHRAASGHERHSGGRDSGHRPRGGRNRSPHLYRRHRGGLAQGRDELRPHAGGAHVRTLRRGPARARGFRDCRGAAGDCGRHERPELLRGQETDKGIEHGQAENRKPRFVL